MRLIQALLAVLVIPALAVAIACAPYMNDLQMTNPLEIFSVAQTCVFTPQSGAGLAQFCDALAYYNWLGLAGLVIGLAGLLLIVFIAVSGIIGGRSRELLASTFRNVTFISLLVMSVIMTGQALLLLATLVLAQIYFLESILIYVVVIGAIMALYVAYATTTGLFGMFRKSQSSVIGMRLGKGQGEAIRGTVKDIADTLKTKAPDNIIVGLEPTFFATSGAVSTPFDKEHLKGDTLYLSLPLMRVLSTDETRSIIGHELGHFSGDDTAYSKLFAPAYIGLYQAQHMMEQQEGWFRFAALPSAAIINFILAIFQPAERRIGREREFRADRVGASVGSAMGLSSSLIKLSAFAAIWNVENNDVVGRVQRGRVSRNLSQNFVDRGRYDVDADKLYEYTKQSLDTEVAHPVDTHPLTSLRVEALGIDAAPLIEPDAFNKSLFPEETLAEQCVDLKELEEGVSEAYQHYISQLVHVDRSDQTRFDNDFSNFLSMLLAKMVTIDGNVDDEEILTAQAEAYQYDANFDGTSFRQFCRHAQDIPSTEDLIAFGNKILNPGGAERLRAILHKVAQADGVIDPAERGLLERIDAELVGGEDEHAPKGKSGGWG